MNSLLAQNKHKIATNIALKVFVCVVVVNLFYINQGLADKDASHTQNQLNKINKIIGEIEHELDKNRRNQKAVLKEMAELEREIGQLHKNIEQTKQHISENHLEHAQLVKQSEILSNKLQAQQSHLQQQMRLAYSTGAQSKWKLLLSQNSLQHVGRNAVIYDYIHKARIEQINYMQQLASEIRSNELAQQEQHKSLQMLLNKQSKAQNDLINVRREKEKIQIRLAKKIELGSTNLKQEKSRQNKLKKLLKKLTVKESKGKFAQKLGKLEWPSTGSLQHRFGDSRQSTADIQWNGVMIKAKKGTEIKAIYPGTVVFSDWFDHYGWLIIIDHGDGYMSLYAHAEGLYKDVDEEVTKGEIIAVVGDSGDVLQSGLYFEIRRQGTPVDPSSWCVTPKMAYSP